MISGVTIRNFRGLREVTLDGLARVNVIVGDNGSGKTALLEALYLAMSNSALQALSLRQMRELPSPTSADYLEALAAAFVGDGDSEARVETRGDGEFARRFWASPDPARATRLAELQPVNGSSGLPPSNVLSVPVVYQWEDSAGRRGESILRGGPPIRAVGSGEVQAVETRFLAASYGGQGNAAALFSELDKAGEAAPFIEAVRAQFPDVETVAVQLEGGQPLLHARLKGQRQQRPLELLSGGLAGLSLMFLTVSRPSTALVLIDEVENGLHHRRFGLLWKQIRDTAVRAETQVFTTTHSLEALDAVAEAMAQHPDDFALLRTARSGNECVVGLLPALEARHLLRSGLEVRG